MTEFTPIIAITMGDPAGVGPEIVARAAASLRALCRPLVVGDLEVMRRAAALAAPGLILETVECVEDAARTWHAGRLPVLSGPPVGGFEPGKPQANCGEAAYGYVSRAIALALRGNVAAVVTAPISKEALWMAGHRVPGHTEIFAAATGSDRYALMLADGPRRVVHATCHVSLQEAVQSLSAERVLETIRLGHEATRRLGVPAPRVALCALNPHAGEGGLFGDEEARILMPAVRAAREEGLDATGPIGADTAFVQAFSGRYDLAVALYHDQGHLPFKLACFQASGGKLSSMRGVNLTLGLPIVRTSVDHGTAWDIAWKGEALPDSLLDAVAMAVKLAQ